MSPNVCAGFTAHIIVPILVFVALTVWDAARKCSDESMGWKYAVACLLLVLAIVAYFVAFAVYS